MVTFLLANWKYFAAGAVLVAVWTFGWRVQTWHEAYRELPQVAAALKSEQECSEGSKCQERQQILEKRASDESEKIRKEYEQDLEDIANRPVPREPVRLCRPSGSGSVRVPGTSTGAGPQGGTELPAEVGRDIRLELYRLANDADIEALKLRKLWERDIVLSEVPAEE